MTKLTESNKVNDLYKLVEEAYYYPEYLGEDVYGHHWWSVYYSENLSDDNLYYVCPEESMQLWTEYPDIMKKSREILEDENANLKKQNLALYNFISENNLSTLWNEWVMNGGEAK